MRRRSLRYDERTNAQIDRVRAFAQWGGPQASAAARDDASGPEWRQAAAAAGEGLLCRLLGRLLCRLLCRLLGRLRLDLVASRTAARGFAVYDARFMIRN